MIFTKQREIARTHVISVSHDTSKVADARGSSHAVPASLSAVARAPIDILNDKRAQHAATAGSGPSKSNVLTIAPRPAQLSRRHSSQPGLVDLPEGQHPQRQWTSTAVAGKHGDRGGQLGK